MSSVQSMRQFVCDRLTAAAQEILGAFEKKIEDYDAEIARQRRLLESVLTPETKLHQTGHRDVCIHKGLSPPLSQTTTLYEIPQYKVQHHQEEQQLLHPARQTAEHITDTHEHCAPCSGICKHHK
ncbi:uncharacterized protein LOC122875788 isoform X4 [Siniperca chuatsi]|uniref:uncharacterized protein LOC122875788 isoform X4 n=1 Tax=Siniperca chuatsi TaxID=119488 RepID=UPI001CE039B6|nr:uncharacterized protein LOC122875788 isoform X4 [Siniperca chuatsi]